MQEKGGGEKETESLLSITPSAHDHSSSAAELPEVILKIRALSKNTKSISTINLSSNNFESTGTKYISHALEVKQFNVFKNFHRFLYFFFFFFLLFFIK